MITSLTGYFERSANHKSRVNKGPSFAKIIRHATGYLVLLAIYFIFTITFAIIEDYPGGITKPDAACMLDLFSEVWELVFAFTHILLSEHEKLWHLLAGAGGVTFKVWKAFVIAAEVPNSEIKTIRHRFNAVAPGVSAAVKSCLILMALPRAVECPGINIRWGQPFEELIGCGKGLTHHEREILLAAVLSSTYPPEGS